MKGVGGKERGIKRERERERVMSERVSGVRIGWVGMWWEPQKKR